MPRNLEPLDLTDDDLDRMAVINEADLLRAFQTAKRALGRLGNILLARPSDVDDTAVFDETIGSDDGNETN